MTIGEIFDGSIVRWFDGFYVTLTIKQSPDSYRDQTIRLISVDNYGFFKLTQ
ncbi:MAG: hypothetical protein AAGJ18_07220 [Bacteroidota bacterium]